MDFNDRSIAGKHCSPQGARNMNRRPWWIGGLGILALAACGQQQGQAAASRAQPIEKTFALKPNGAVVQVAFLAGQLQDLRVSEEVDGKTGVVVTSPLLHGTLKLKNISEDRAARLVSGKLQYLDSDGKPIRLAPDRRDTGFTLNTYQTDRLEPGVRTSEEIEVPFPTAALEKGALRGIRLDLTYTPMPYKDESVTIPVSVSG
jgi:hypothetical protein